VRPATIWRWRARQLDTFTAEEARMKLFEHLPKVYEILSEKAEDGSAEHMQLFLRVTSTLDRNDTDERK
jgi:hypothetical protein